MCKETLNPKLVIHEEVRHNIELMNEMSKARSNKGLKLGILIRCTS